MWPGRRKASETFVDGQVIEPEGVPVRLRLSGRARRVSLRIDQASGEALAIAPDIRRLPEAAAFARQRIGWIRAHLAKAPERQGIAASGRVPFEGRWLAVRPTGSQGAARLVEGDLLSGGEGEALSRRVEAWLRRQARERLEARTAHHAATLGKTAKVGLTDAKGRWGSCTPGRGAIRYSWRLVMAPPEVLDYVCAHEVAHLAHANHGPEFWALCERLYGRDPKPARAWLRTHGARLHAVG